MNIHELTHRPKKFTPLLDGIKGPEGPALGPDGLIYFVSTVDSKVLRLNNKNEISIVHNIEGKPNGLAFGLDGELYIADAGTKAILRSNLKDDPEIFCDEYDGTPFVGHNDICVLENGDLLFTDPLRLPDPDPSMSPVFKVNIKGESSPFVSDLAYPNGVAISFDGEDVIVSESKANRLISISLNNPNTQSINQKLLRRFLEPGRPDGIAIDIEGNLLVCLPGIDSVAKLDKNGTLIDLFHVPNWRPENLAFGGENNQTVFVCSGLQSAIHTFTNDFPGLNLPRN